MQIRMIALRRRGAPEDFHKIALETNVALQRHATIVRWNEQRNCSRSAVGR